jgi:hypothetical protein
VSSLKFAPTFYCYKIRALNSFVISAETELGRNYQSLRA